ATLNIAEALEDPNLLGAALGDLSSWRLWLVTLKAAFGIRLTVKEKALFSTIAGGRPPPRKRVQSLWVVAGRGGGKSRMAAAVSTYLAALIEYSTKLARGETGVVLVLAPTTSQAQIVFRYILGFLEASPILSTQIRRITQDEIDLAGNITVAVHPANY